MSYFDRFASESVRFSSKDKEGNVVEKELPFSTVHVGRADLYTIALSILADCDDKTSHPNARNSAFLAAYDRVPGGFSARKAAKTIVDLYDQVSGQEFASEMFMNYRNWGRGKRVKGKFVSDTFDEELNYDPYVLSLKQAKTPLAMASMTVLVKAFRFYLEETLRHFFQKSDPDRWYPFTDPKTKKVVKPEACYAGRRTSAPFSAALDTLLKIYDQVYNLTPLLDEYTQATEHAVTDGRAEADVKRSEKDASRATKRVHVTGSRDEKKVGQRDEKNALTRVPEPRAQPKKRPAKVVVTDEDGWSTAVKVGGHDIEEPEDVHVEESEESEESEQALEHVDSFALIIPDLGEQVEVK
jgi:hypothetical protein